MRSSLLRRPAVARSPILHNSTTHMRCCRSNFCRQRHAHFYCTQQQQALVLVSAPPATCNLRPWSGLQLSAFSLSDMRPAPGGQLSAPPVIVSDVLGTVSVQHHPAAHLYVGISASCSTLGSTELQLQLRRLSVCIYSSSRFGVVRATAVAISVSAELDSTLLVSCRCNSIQASATRGIGLVFTIQSPESTEAACSRQPELQQQHPWGDIKLLRAHQDAVATNAVLGPAARFHLQQQPAPALSAAVSTS